MSVVVKGMGKPSDCDYCTLQDDSYCNVLLSYINVEHGIDTRCPITEISEYKLKNGHRVVVAEQTEPHLCVECANYAGDGMYCAENEIVYDFSRACKWWNEDVDGKLKRPQEAPKRTMTEEHKKNISDAAKRKWAERKTEPQTDVSCFACVHDATGHIECQSCDDNYSSYEPKDEPQTERSE